MCMKKVDYINYLYPIIEKFNIRLTLCSLWNMEINKLKTIYDAVEDNYSDNQIARLIHKLRLNK